MSRLSWANEGIGVWRLGLLTPIKNMPDPSSASRADKIARSCRRRRLRRTAEPKGRPMAKATCGEGSEGSRSMTHHKKPLRTRVPSLRRR